jgi:predicted nucleic acid-binding protein
MDITFSDAGPLVALLDEGDRWHAWARESFQTLRPPIYTCEAVLTEAWHQLRRFRRSRAALANLCARGALVTSFDFEAESDAVWRLLNKYADTPMDFADACLVRMAELNPLARIWTVDSDFFVYRCHGRQAIPLVFPD